MKRNMFGQAILGLAVVGLVAGCRPSRSQQQTSSGEEERKAVVQVALVDSGEVIRRVTFVGTLAGSRQVPILSDVPGKIRHFRVGEGERVQQGDTLAFVDRSLPGMRYEPFPILAPIAGYVHWEVFTSGTPVGPQRPLGWIYALPLEVRFRIPAQHTVREGYPLWVAFSDDTLRGEVYWVSEMVDPSTQTREVRGILRRNAMLRPGQMVKVRTVVARRHGMRIPRRALLFAPRPYVVRIQEGRARKRFVEPLLIGDRYVLVEGDLQAGDTVVVVGHRVVRENQRVIVREVTP